MRKIRAHRITLIALLVCFFGLGIYLAKGAMARLEFNDVYDKAEAGNKREQFRLAHMYQIGKFTEIDLDKAKHWYRRAGTPAAKDVLCWELNECPS